MSFYDFLAIKKSVLIDEAAKMVGLELKDGRCCCPSCGTVNPRSLTVKTERNVFYCFHAKKGGDVLSLVSHCLQIPVKDAAEMLVNHIVDQPPDEEPSGDSGELKPLDHLDPKEALGIESTTANAVGVGYAKKGLMRGHVAIPLYTQDTLVGYIGIPKDTKVKLPKNLEVCDES